MKDAEDIQWYYDDSCISISDENKASIKITGLSTKTAAAGEAKLTCRYRDVTYTTYVHVEDPSLTVKGDLIRLNPNKYNYTLTLTEGEKFTLEQKHVVQTVNWKSSNKSKSSVTEDGVIYAKDSGTVTVSGKVNNKTVKIKVKVY